MSAIMLNALSHEGREPTNFDVVPDFVHGDPCRPDNLKNPGMWVQAHNVVRYLLSFYCFRIYSFWVSYSHLFVEIVSRYINSFYDTNSQPKYFVSDIDISILCKNRRKTFWSNLGALLQ